MSGVFEQKHEHVKGMKRVYICHPYRNDPDGNLRKVNDIVVKIGLSNAKGMVKADQKDQEVYDPNVVSFTDLLTSKYSGLVTPVSPMLAFPKDMSETGKNPISEDHGMAFCYSLLASCHEIWVFSREITDGMAMELTAASEWGIKIVWMV